MSSSCLSEHFDFLHESGISIFLADRVTCIFVHKVSNYSWCTIIMDTGHSLLSHIWMNVEATWWISWLPNILFLLQLYTSTLVLHGFKDLDLDGLYNKGALFPLLIYSFLRSPNDQVVIYSFKSIITLTFLFNRCEFAIPNKNKTKQKVVFQTCKAKSYRWSQGVIKRGSQYHFHSLFPGLTYFSYLGHNAIYKLIHYIPEKNTPTQRVFS